MRNKKIFFIICFSTLIVIAFIIFAGKKRDQLALYNLNKAKIPAYIGNSESNEQDISQAFQRYFKESQNLESYAFLEIINDYLKDGIIEFTKADSIEKGNDFLEYYDMNGNRIENFPIEFLLDENGNYKGISNFFQIEINKDFLFKYYCNNDGLMYYYLGKLDNNYNLELKLICYTHGEYLDFDGPHDLCF